MKLAPMIAAFLIVSFVAGCSTEKEQARIDSVAKAYTSLKLDIDGVRLELDGAKAVAAEALDAARDAAELAASDPDPAVQAAAAETLAGVEAAQAVIDGLNEKYDGLNEKYETLLAKTDGILDDLKTGNYESAGGQIGALIGGLLGPQGIAIGSALGVLGGGLWQRRRGNAIVANLAGAIDAAKLHNPQLTTAMNDSSSAINARLDPATRRLLAAVRNS